MNYNDLITTYPWIDLIMEIFKGTMPTIVALFAIYMNNKKAKTREKNNAKREHNNKLLATLQDDALFVNDLLYESGAQFLYYVSDLKSLKADENLDKYANKITYAVRSARQLYNKSNLVAIIIGNDVLKFDEIFLEVDKFPKKISEIMEYHDMKSKKILTEKEYDNLLDDIQKKMIDISTVIEASIMEYVTNVSALIEKAYE